MPATQDQAFTLDLTTEEIKRLPPILRKKIVAALGDDSITLKRWVLVGVATTEQATVTRKTVHAVNQIVCQRRKAITENHIERLVDLYLEGEQRAEVDAALELDNAELRTAYLKQTQIYTAQDIHTRSPNAKPKNQSEPASRWKREKRLFAVRYKGNDLFPCFQFADGVPRPVVKKILLRLPNDMTPWQIAFWFASGNGWLDGKAPQDVLSDESAVLIAAEQMGETTVG